MAYFILDKIYTGGLESGKPTIGSDKILITIQVDTVADIPIPEPNWVPGSKLYVLENGGSSYRLNNSQEWVKVNFDNLSEGGDGTEDIVARSLIDEHTGNTEIHVTAEEKAAWNEKAELSDIPTTLPANGGDADTVDGKHSYEITPYHQANDRPYGTLTARIENVGNEVFKLVLRDNDGNIVSGVKFTSIADGGNADTVGNKGLAELVNYGFNYADRVSITTGDLNNYISGGRFMVITTAAAGAITHGPWTNTGYFLDVYSRADSYVVQIAMNWVGEILIRYVAGNDWSEWANLKDGGNADTLDGLHANEIVSNPNLFINSDFRHPINQRGKTSYDTEGYTIDCWSISTNLTLTVCDGYIKLVKSVLSGNPTFLQHIENMSEIAGKTVTFSMHYRSNVQLRITGLDKNYYIPSTSGEWGDYKLTFTAPTGVNYLFSIQFTTAVTQADNYIDIMWTKAELGSIATPFTPPDPATELAKCQRYFVRLKNEHASQYAYNGTGYIMNATTAVITLSLPAVMRTPKPTVTASGENIPCIITPSVPAKTPMTATYSNNSAMLANSISLVFTISNGTAGEPAMFLLKPGSDYIDISAEL